MTTSGTTPPEPAETKTQVCSACPVQKGECPICLTFWIPAVAGTPGKRYGVRRVDGNSLVEAGGDTRHPGNLTQWPNVVTQR